MKKLLSLVLVICLCLPLASCLGAKKKFSAYSFDYFDTVTSIVGYESSEAEFNRARDIAMEMFSEYHKLYDIYHVYDSVTNICSLNRLTDGQHEALNVDSRIVELLLYAKEMYSLTNGKMNVCMGSVLSIWHDYRTEGINSPSDARLPTMEELEAAAEHTDIEKLIIDQENGTVFISDPQMKLDVGAVAKGYAVEMVAKELESQGFDGYVLNVGGNVRTIGVKGDGEKWSVGIDNPDSEDEPYYAILSLSGESLVTSGSYQRFYNVDGKNYHHIINPTTLMPSEYYRSVSVITTSSALADVLSTALFSMTVTEGSELIESLDGVEAMWVENDGDIVYSSGFDRYIEAEKSTKN